MIRIVCMLVGLLGAGLPGRAWAEPPANEAVALLPLDADRGLEIYGQPVASEIARALGAGNVQVVVVGPRMAVPEHARLIIDGTIARDKGSSVTITLRIRNAVEGVTVKTVASSAPGLAKIDRAAAELSAEVLPIVRRELDVLRQRAEDHGRVTEVRAPPAGAPDRPVLIAIRDTRPRPDPALTGALEAAATSWTRAHHRQVQQLDPAKLDARLAVKTVATSGADLAIGFWVLGYVPEPGPPPMARARVRVQITDARSVVFDRIVVTATVIGDNGIAAPELAARVAREVLAILRPHLRRSVPSWE
jgi:hypothetical protein